MLQLTNIGDLDEDTLSCWNVANSYANHMGGFRSLSEKTGGDTLGHCGIENGLCLFLLFYQAIERPGANIALESNDTNTIVEREFVHALFSILRR